MRNLLNLGRAFKWEVLHFVQDDNLGSAIHVILNGAERNEESPKQGQCSQVGGSSLRSG